MKFNESSIPQNYSQSLMRLTVPMDVDASIAYQVYEIMFTSMADFLRLVKSNSNKVAISIEGVDGHMYMAGVVTYHENEDKDMPGNYSYEITLNKEDLEDAKVYTIADNGFAHVVNSVYHSMHNMIINQQSYIIDLFTTAAKVLLEWLDVNASEKEEKSVTLDGFFVASVVVEDGEKIFSIVPDGAMKRLIKDDTAIEK